MLYDALRLAHRARSLHSNFGHELTRDSTACSVVAWMVFLSRDSARLPTTDAPLAIKHGAALMVMCIRIWRYV